MDTNATLVAALLHTITLPITMFIFNKDGANYEGINFESMVADPEQRLTIKEGTIFHYWTYKKPLTWGWLLITAAVDLVLAPLSVLTIVTVPIQYLIAILQFVFITPA